MHANHAQRTSMMREFSRWIQDSKESQLDASTEAIINNLRRQVARRRWKRANTMVSLALRLSTSSFGNRSTSPSITNNDLEEDSVDYLDRMDPNRAMMVQQLRRQVARYRWKRAISRVILGLRLTLPAHPNFDAGNEDDSSLQNGANIFVDMEKLMSEAMQEKPKYFREGSVMNNLIESGIEVVWFSDLTQSDVVYGICCQREEKRVTVVFRGTVNSHNWYVSYFMTTKWSLSLVFRSML